MENGVERVGGGPELVEEENVESQVVGDDKVGERLVVGSDRSKDVEDEVFEEAIDSPEQLVSNGVKVELGVSVQTENDLVSKSTDGNLNVGSEVETFEEVIDVDASTASVRKLEELGGEEEVKDLVGGDSVDKIDEGSNTDVDLIRENIVDDGQEKESKEDELGIEYQRIRGPVGALIELQEDKDEGVDENVFKTNTECSVEKSEELEVDTPVSDYANGVHENEESVNDYKSMETEPHNDSNSNVNDASVLLDSVHQAEPKELNVSSAVLHAEEAIAVPEILNSHSAEVVNDNHEQIATNEGNLQTDDMEVPEQPHVDQKVNGFSKDGVVVKQPETEAEKEVEEKETTQDREILPPTKIAFSSEKSAGSEELNSNSAVLHAKEAIVMPEILSPHLTKSVNDNIEEILTHEGNLRADDTKVPEPPHVDQKVNGVSNDSVVLKQPEKEAEKGKKEKQTIQEREILPPTKTSSSSEKSAGSATTPARPAGLGRAAPLLEPAPRSVQQHPRGNGTLSNMQSQQIEEPTNGEGDECDETREKLQMIRVKFLRLAHRLGQTPHNVVVAQVLYRLGLAEQLRGRNGGRVGAFSFDRASAMAEQLEASGQEPLDFSCTIMVLGKTGVGKSATINSLFDEVKFGTDAFQLGTKKVQDVVGTVQGIKVRVIDTPGLLPSGSDQRQNEKILHSVKRFIKSTPPDIVLYLDRLDMQSRDFGDMPLLRTITEIFGPSIWFNAIVVLTHAASAPPDGPNGTASSYDMFVTQRSHVVQQAIRQAAGDMRLMNPVSLVENHSACRTNRAGQRVLPNGQVWKPHLLLLSFASKILAEANALLKLQDSPPGKPFATRSRSASLPFLLSSLLQPRPQLKLPEEQFGDDDDLDDDLEESSDSEDDSEFEDLPPFKSLTKAQVAKLTRAQKKAYFDELEYREKLFMTKQLKEEKKRRKMMKKMAASSSSEYNEPAEEETGSAASVPVPMPDLALPASFDSDNPTHRYRYLDTSNQWLVRPVLETHGWDHDVGYEGINVERLFVVKDKIPLSLSGQVTKDKKDANVQMEIMSSIKHGEGKSTSLGFDMQTVGKDLAYTLRSETRFCNFRKNKATAGLSVTLLGDALSAGLKVEDKLIANKRFRMVMSGGAMTGRGDVAYGGSLEVQLKDKDYPLGRSLSTLGLSVMDWHGDLAIGCNIQSQLPVGRSTNLIARGNLNNRGSGQVSIRVNSSEQLQIALIGLFPLLKKLIYGYPQQASY